MKRFLLRWPLFQEIDYWRQYLRDARGIRRCPEQTIRRRFLKKCGYEPDFAHPTTYNEKLQWLKLHWRDPLAERCADKVAVRRYVAEKGYADRLIPLLHVYDSARAIDFSALPARFALKAAHGSGMNVICADRAKLDIAAARRLTRRWMRVDYSLTRGEWVYHNVPRRIVCEPFLETADGLPPRDIKIYCFHGEPKCVMIASGRGGERLCMDFFTPAWERMPFTRHNPNSDRPPDKPEGLAEMLEMARVLSAPFPHARVDLYEERGRIWFGEITFFPASGMQPFAPRSYDELFGSWLDLDRVPRAL